MCHTQKARAFNPATMAILAAWRVVRKNAILIAARPDAMVSDPNTAGSRRYKSDFYT